MSEIVVGIGEVQVAIAPATLIARGLGSCVGVILYDPAARKGVSEKNRGVGINHQVSPERERSGYEM